MTQDSFEAPFFMNDIHFTCSFMDPNPSIVPDALTHLLLHSDASTVHLHRPLNLSTRLYTFL
jgi:hypothetical protein